MTATHDGGLSLPDAWASRLRTLQHGPFARAIQCLAATDGSRHLLLRGPRCSEPEVLLGDILRLLVEHDDLAQRWEVVHLDAGLYHVTGLDELWSAARPYLDARISRRPLVVVPHFDRLVDEQFSPEARRTLASALRADRGFTLLATAEGPDPAPGAFASVELEPLHTDQVAHAWLRICGRSPTTLEAACLELLTEHRAGGVRALAGYARSAHRFEAAAALSVLLGAERAHLRGTVHRLPGLERKVLATLAERWSPSTSAEVAADAGIAVNKTSAFLHRLESRGLVRVTHTLGRTIYWEVADRLLNLLFLTERRGAGQARLRALLDFLEWLVAEVEPAGAERRIDHVLALARVVQPPADPVGLLFHGTHGDLDAALQARESGDRELAEMTLRRVLDDEPGHPVATATLADLLVEGHRFPEAAAICEEALAMAPWDAAMRARLGVARHGMGDTAGAADDLQTAVQLLPAEPLPWVALVLLAPTSATPEQAREALPIATAALEAGAPAPAVLDLLVALCATAARDDLAARLALDGLARTFEPLTAALGDRDLRRAPVEVDRVALRVLGAASARR